MLNKKTSRIIWNASVNVSVQMTKKRKGQDADGEDDGEQCRTPIRSELDKLESKYSNSVFCWLHALVLISQSRPDIH